MTLLPYAVAAGPLLETAKLQPGETVIIGPATGTYSGAAVKITLALGANVVAFGRREEKLAKMRKTLKQPKRFQTIVVTGDVMSDIIALQRVLLYGADIHSNWSPSETKETLYLGLVSAVLNRNARIVLSGQSEILGSLHPGLIVVKNISVAGKFMYSQNMVRRVMHLVSSGLLNIGERSGAIVNSYRLEDFDEAVKTAERRGT